MHFHKFILVAVVFTLLNGCSKTQVLYIKNARLPFPSERLIIVENDDLSAYEKYEIDQMKSKDLLLGGHYIKDGKNIVLLIRKWNPGKIWVIDDELYEKMTIEIMDYQLGTPNKLPSHQVKIYYSKGGSAWIKKGAGIYSSDAVGEIIFLRISDENLRAKINISLNAKSAYNFDSNHEISVKFEGEYSFSEILFKDLTPWLGMPDPPLYTGGYPD